jgi:thioredoxin reductase/Pyruvate/2-oxoacid:ferredoxin oxidoreductase delta subunit
MRAQKLGLDEPSSLHPVIDPLRCVGCAGCIEACPENDVLQLVDGRARLVNAAHCIGHGLCQTACPSDAIELVFGTEKRGVQLPEVKGDYQSNVPGIYIAGELGGMGLIRNAMNQGIQAVSAIHRQLAAFDHRGSAAAGIDCDVAIVGAGPAGIAAALACQDRGLSHLVLDQDGLGGTVNHYPRRKLVMTAPIELPIVGRFHYREINKEELLQVWKRIVNQGRLRIQAPWRVVGIERDGEAFHLLADGGSLRARRVLLAIGRRGSPRKLGVPGEDTSKVAYRLMEPEPFADQDVLVVGGGNSAVEMAMSLAEAGARTTLSYRGKNFSRVAPENQERMGLAAKSGLDVVLESQVRRIEKERVVLQTPQGEKTLTNAQVFVAIGGELPTQFLEKIGVAMHWHHGSPRKVVPLRMEQRA